MELACRHIIKIVVKKRDGHYKMGSTDEENFVICLREMFPQDGSKDVEIRNEKSQEVDEFIKTNKN